MRGQAKVRGKREEIRVALFRHLREVRIVEHAPVSSPALAPRRLGLPQERTPCVAVGEPFGCELCASSCSSARRHARRALRHGSRAVGERPAQSVRPRQGHNVLVAHAVLSKHPLEVLNRVFGALRGPAKRGAGVGQAERTRRRVFRNAVESAVAHGHHGPARALDGSRACELKQVGPTHERAGLFYGGQVLGQGFLQACVGICEELVFRANRANGTPRFRPPQLRPVLVVGSRIVPREANQNGGTVVGFDGLLNF
mmetsp:Transcript_5405/g.10270  ORF Transcript_5405/g.10270 Transcript_5405/m.10270 type:complete len:256 (+) Transcript_5405:379-1146(+)